MSVLCFTERSKPWRFHDVYAGLMAHTADHTSYLRINAGVHSATKLNSGTKISGKHI